MSAGRSNAGNEIPYRIAARALQWGTSSGGPGVGAPVGYWVKDGVIEAGSLGASGRLDNVPAGPSEVWNVGGIRTLPLVAAPVDIVSSSPADTVAGAGAGRVFVPGLDADYNLISEVVELKGNVPVQTSQNYLRVFPAHIVQAGNAPPAPARNIGRITATVGGNTQWQIDPEAAATNFGSGTIAALTVPAGYSGFIRESYAVLQTLTAANAVALSFVFQGRDGTQVESPRLTLGLDGPRSFGELPIQRIPERTDVMIRARRVAGEDTTPLFAGFNLDIFQTGGMSTP